AEARAQIPALLAGDVVAVGPLLAEATLVPALLDVLEELDAQLVGVESAGAGRDDARVCVGEVDDLGVLAGELGHDLRVPVRRPAFIHDLRHALWREV